MIRKAYVLMLVIISITGIAQHRHYTKMDDEGIISDLYADMYRAMIDKDTARLSGILDADFVLVHMTGMSQSKNSYLRYISEGTLNYYSCEDSELNIKVNGDCAYIIGRSHVLAAVFGGGRHRWPLRLDITLRKKMNRWLITKAVASTF